ncbi:glycerate kinase [Campylobacter sp. Cr9]|uniref:glycerate kinase n=1 Tax=Campylobacter sp. Cr9 TaxID=2735728 RepID=UPI003014C66E|nr:glycerate kinase [Campylobacter sp. Cr9]
MNALIICDSFKGSLSSNEANEAISNACKKLNIAYKSYAISDGGEGFLESINSNLNADKIYLKLKNAYGKRDYNGYYLLKDKRAFFEMAEFAGLAQLSEDEKNPCKTSTKSLGIAIKDAIKKGAKEFVIGIGGSATTDAGIGMLSALGYKFLDGFNNELLPIGENLIKIKSINDENVLKELKNCSFKIACDVVNPLYGSNGAAFVYARQKGANDEEIKLLDLGLRNFALICEKYFKNDFAFLEGMGAAGGLGFGFKAFLNAEFESGFSYIKNLLNLEENIKNSSLVITGEGAFDEQSIMGKVIGSINNLCEIYKKDLIIFCGINKSDFKNCFSLTNEYPNKTKNELMDNNTAYKCLNELSLRVLQTFLDKK